MDTNEPEDKMVAVFKSNPGSISSNLAELKIQLDKEMAAYAGAKVTEDNYRDAYNSRSSLKKLETSLDGKQRSMKIEYMLPYEDFLVEYKLMKQSLTDLWADLDTQIKAVDQERINKKRTAIEEMIAERLAKEPEHIEAYIRSCSWAMWVKQWENKGTKFEEAEFEFNGFVDSIKANYEIMATHGQYAQQIMEKYAEKGSLTDALKLGKKLEEDAKAFQAVQDRIKAAEQTAPKVNTSIWSEPPTREPEPEVKQPKPEPVEEFPHDFCYPYPEVTDEKSKTVVKVAFTITGPAFMVKWVIAVADIMGVTVERFNPSK